MSSYINTAADCTIKQYEACAFQQRYRVLVLEGDPTDEELKNAFDLINAEYIDLSGLYVTREFDLSAHIHYLHIRKTTIEEFVRLQRKFIEQFGVPFVSEFRLVKKYGYSFNWNHEAPNLEHFLSKLNKVASQEVRYGIELSNKTKELFELRSKRIAKEAPVLETRKQFMTMIIRLQQSKFVIDRNKTTVEELALMIADQKDQQDQMKAEQSFKRKSY
jgi:hypothetical protein